MRRLALPGNGVNAGLARIRSPDPAAGSSEPNRGPQRCHEALGWEKDFDRVPVALPGYKQGELLGGNLARVESQPGDEPDRLVEEINDRLHAQRLWQGELAAVRKDHPTFKCATQVVAMEVPGKLCGGSFCKKTSPTIE